MWSKDRHQHNLNTYWASQNSMVHDLMKWHEVKRWVTNSSHICRSVSHTAYCDGVLWRWWPTAEDGGSERQTISWRSGNHITQNSNKSWFILWYTWRKQPFKTILCIPDMRFYYVIQLLKRWYLIPDQSPGSTTWLVAIYCDSLV